MRALWRRFDFWTSRNRWRLAIALITCFGVGVIAGITGVPALEWAGRIAVLLAIPLFVCVAVGIRFAGGPTGGGGIGGPGDGTGGN